MDAPGRAGRIKAEINVTPLVDIVLVLLIIFIVITPAVNSAVKLPLARHSVRPGAPGRTLSLLYSAARDPLTGKVTGPAPCRAAGSRTELSTAGVITMKMISSTRTMSTSGVTLISAFTPGSPGG